MSVNRNCRLLLALCLALPLAGCISLIDEPAPIDVYALRGQPLDAEGRQQKAEEGGRLDRRRIDEQNAWSRWSGIGV